MFKHYYNSLKKKQKKKTVTIKNNTFPQTNAQQAQVWVIINKKKTGHKTQNVSEGSSVASNCVYVTKDLNKINN